MMTNQDRKSILEFSTTDAMKRLLLLFILMAGISFIVRGNEPYKGYRAYVDGNLGAAYNPTPAEKFSINNMQTYAEISTTHGFCLNNWFVGAGMGYYHSFRDKENIYPIYAAGRYTFEKAKLRPFIEIRAGVVYDPFWISTVQAYGALSAGLKVYKRLQTGVRFTVFRRPSRFFTANTALVLSYEFGK